MSRRVHSERRRRRDGGSRPIADGTGGRWLAPILGILAGAWWFGWCWYQVSRPSAAFEADLLHFPSGDNIALLAGGRNEPHALELRRQDGAGGRRLVAEFELPDYRGALGSLAPDRFVRDPALRPGELRSVGLYFELAAGAGTPWQTDAPLGLRSGELQLPDGRVFQAKEPAKGRRGNLVEFEPSSRRVEPSDRLRLSLEVVDDRRLYLRGLVRTLSPGQRESAVPPLGRLVMHVGRGPGEAREGTLLFYPEGRCTWPIPGAPPPRIALLARVFGVSQQALLAFLGFGGVSLGAGVGCLVAGVRSERRGWTVGFGLALATAGLAASAVPLIVPYHGPDENRHALSYARFRADERVMESFITLGQRAHAERFRYQPDARLSSRTLEQPDGFFVARTMLAPKVIGNFFQDWRRRAPALALVWGVTADWLPDQDAGSTLLGLRLVQVLLASLLLGVGGMVLAPVLGRAGARWLATTPLLLLPLPVLLASVTNYSVLVAAAALLGMTLLRLALRPDDDWRVAALIGLALGLVIHISLNGLPLIPVVLLWLGHRPLLRWLAEDEAEPPGDAPAAGATRWWFALAAGFAVTRLTGTAGHLQELRAQVGAVLGGAGGVRVAAEPALWVAGAAGIFALLEAAAGQGRAGALALAVRVGIRRSSAAGPWLALGIVVIAVAGLLRPPPTLEDLEQPWRTYPGVPSSGCPLHTVRELDTPPDYLGRGEQVCQVMRVFLANLTPMPRDFVLVRGFWTGLLGGEVRVPGVVGSLGLGFELAGLVLGGLVIGERRSVRGAVTAAWGGIAFLFGLAGLAATYWPRNLYGRYATPLLLLLLIASGAGWMRTLDRLARSSPGLLAGLWIAVLLVIHSTWVQCLTDRFF